jgi:hypothetical protein
MTDSSNNTTKFSWTTTIEDANDGTGDGILTFPPELCEMQGWKEGTLLYLSVKNGGLIISDKPFETL